VDAIVRRIDRLAGLVVQPSALTDHVALFRIEAGRLNGPIPFAVQGPQAHAAAPGPTFSSSSSSSSPAASPSVKTQSMESRLTGALATVPLLPAASAMETMEQLAYLKRWYYRSRKVGEIFFTDEKGELPLRRVVRGLSRVFRGEEPAAELSETARDYWVNRGRAAELNPEDYNV